MNSEHALPEDLGASEQAAALRYRQQALRRIADIPDVPADTPVREIGSVGVIGVGTMGVGIAMVFANADLPVRLIATRSMSLDRGLAAIQSQYRRGVSRGSWTEEEAERRLSLIRGDVGLDALAGTDLVIEAAVERMDVKRDIFAQLDRVARPGAILATNTSYLDIDEIARGTGRPQDVLGLHFFTPAHVMRLLEVIRGERTSKEVVATALALGRRLGKIPVLSRVGYGFIGNRLMNARQMGADSLLLEGVMPWAIDEALYDFGFPLGTFAMWDLAGLDVGWVKEESRGQSVKACLCEMGRLGRKSGAGYYDYDDKGQGKPSSVTEALVRRFAAQSGRAARSIDRQEILERCLFPMVNEGARILEEGIALRASDVDVVWQEGYKWPVYRGGPMYWADRVGLKVIVAALGDMRARVGKEFRPAALLEEMAFGGRRFGRL